MRWRGDPSDGTLLATGYNYSPPNYQIDISPICKKTKG